MINLKNILQCEEVFCTLFSLKLELEFWDLCMGHLFFLSFFLFSLSLFLYLLTMVSFSGSWFPFNSVKFIFFTLELIYLRVWWGLQFLQWWILQLPSSGVQESFRMLCHVVCFISTNQEDHHLKICSSKCQGTWCLIRNMYHIDVKTM